MKTLPLPSHDWIRAMHRGYARAKSIRDLYAERCSVHEIAHALDVPASEVRRVLRAVAPKRPPPLDIPKGRPHTRSSQPPRVNGRWVAL